jgi:hypothetical protein
MDLIPREKVAHASNERRRIERFDLRLPARIEDLSPSQIRQPVVLNLVTKDISAYGAFFPSAHSIEEGTRVKVDLILAFERAPQGKRALIKVNGTVLRKTPAGMAVNFERYKLVPLNPA